MHVVKNGKISLKQKKTVSKMYKVDSIAMLTSIIPPEDALALDSDPQLIQDLRSCEDFTEKPTLDIVRCTCK